MGREYRPLSADEVDLIRAQGCTADDFSAIEVTEGFNAQRVRGTRFSGKVKIGELREKIAFFGNVQEPSGIYNAQIHNCVIGNNVYISNVENYIANYIIEDEVVIRHINLLAVEGESSFGNGVKAAVINEGGGREVPIYDYLSSHIAYLVALYRDREKVLHNLGQMIEEYVRSVSSSMGTIAKGARLMDCGILKNVKVGPGALIEGARHMENCSINSCAEDATRIGTGVIIHDCIVCSGARITNNSIIEKCFVGQGTELGRQYSAENSLFFANCRGYHGEACSIFAGPFTVTYHKSTLLIAGLYSFLNAGSGSNQSNHMYKLGPIHQGIVERGSKTTSDSYMLWPARVGAFTLVMGRHYGNSDTSDLPFSYLLEHEDESILVPGANLRSVGTIRDSRKWPKRDRRKTKNILDLITYGLLTPYTVQKMIKGTRVLEDLKEASAQEADHYYYNNVKIKRTSLENGIRLYRMGIDRYLGNCLVQRLRQKQIKSLSDLREALVVEGTLGRGQWVDIAGLVVPEEALEELLSEIEAGKSHSLEQVTKKFQALYDNFTEYEWAWTASALENLLGKSLAQADTEDIISLINKWIGSVEELDNLRCLDAEKEFSGSVRIGYGLDGDEMTRERDFNAVRGSVQDNSFIQDLKQRLGQKQQTAKELISQLEKIA